MNSKLRKKLILLVDDESEIRIFLREQIEKTFANQFIFSEANSVRMAIAILRNQDVFLVISDLHMGEERGTEVLNFTQTIHEQPYFIFFTGSGVGLENNCETKNFLGLINKPNYKEILVALKNLSNETHMNF